MQEIISKVLSDLRPALIPGLIYGIGAAGVFLITFFIRITDLTILGSFLLSGVIGIWAANIFGDFIGILFGMICGASCGFFVSMLIYKLRIQPVIAGIISYGVATAGVYAIISKNGSMDRKGGTFLVTSFALQDLILVIVIGLSITLLIHLLAQSKWGGLVSALLAKPGFIRTRHSYRVPAASSIFIIGHGIIGISGFLIALKCRTATAEMSSSTDFLIKAFGAYYGGYVFATWGKSILGFIFHKLRASTPIPDIGEEEASILFNRIRRSLVSESIESKIGILLAAQILGCVILNSISLLATQTGSASNYMLQAILLLIFVKLARTNQESF